MYMGRGMLRRGDELWMYYVGFDYTHGDRDTLDRGGNGVISRLVLRLDGFVSADADYRGERSSAGRSAFRATASS